MQNGRVYLIWFYALQKGALFFSYSCKKILQHLVIFGQCFSVLEYPFSSRTTKTHTGVFIKPLTWNITDRLPSVFLDHKVCRPAVRPVVKPIYSFFDFYDVEIGFFVWHSFLLSDKKRDKFQAFNVVSFFPLYASFEGVYDI